MISLNSSLDDERWEQNRLDNDSTIKLIETLCDSNTDDFKLLHKPQFIMTDGIESVIISNGNAQFLCKVDKRGYIIKCHYSVRGNRKGKSKYHQHDRQNWDWATCLRDICRTHTPYPNAKKVKTNGKLSMWDKLSIYNEEHK